MVYAFSYLIDIIPINLGINEKEFTYTYPIQYDMDLYIINNISKTFNTLNLVVSGIIRIFVETK